MKPTKKNSTVKLNAGMRQPIAPVTIAAWEIETAQRMGYEALTEAIKTLERATAEIKRYRENYVIADSHVTEADCLNWALHHLASSVLGNARLDILASAQVRLTAASTKYDLLKSAPPICADCGETYDMTPGSDLCAPCAKQHDDRV